MGSITEAIAKLKSKAEWLETALVTFADLEIKTDRLYPVYSGPVGITIGITIVSQHVGGCDTLFDDWRERLAKHGLRPEIYQAVEDYFAKSKAEYDAEEHDDE